MPCWPVAHRDGIYQVTDSDGILYPITMAGAPVSTLLPGWYPVGLQTGLPPLHLLELRHDGGPGDERPQDAIWYLTDALEFITHTTAHLGKARTDQVVSSLSPLLRDIHDQTLCAELPAVAPSSHAFDGINAYGLRDLIGLVVEAGLTPPEVVVADRMEISGDVHAAAGRTLSASLVRHSLDVVLPETPQDAFTLASPFDASLLTAQEDFMAGGEFSRVCRFRDAAAATTLYILVRPEGAPVLYVPAMNTVFASRDDVSGAAVMTALFGYYATHTDQAMPAAAAPALPEPELPRQAPHQPPVTNWWKRMFGLGHS